MSSADVIDALFVKTVDIVQSLPKTGPIQTSYEEKLALYSLYKQATEGDVESKRPGMLDMLGRAKWDAWSKVRRLSSRDAKQMYVESMLRILKRFSDRPQALTLIEELESFSGQVAQRVMDGSLAQVNSDDSSASSDTDMDDDAELDQPHFGQSQQFETARLSQPVQPASVAGASVAATRGGDAFAFARQTAAPYGHESEDENRDRDRFDDKPRMAASGGRYTGGPPSVGAYSQPQPRLHKPASVGGSERPSRIGGLHSHMTSPRKDLLGLQTYMPSSNSGAQTRFHSSAQSPAPSNMAVAASHSRPGDMFASQRSNYAASSVGGRSGRTAPTHPPFVAKVGSLPPPTTLSALAVGAQPAKPEVELALQSIQASLAALHERLNRVEKHVAGSLDGSARRPRWSNASSLTRQLANSLYNIVHDLGQLMGLGETATGKSARSEPLAPSFLADGNRGDQTNAMVSLFSAPIRILIALVYVIARLALDLTSLTLVVTILLYMWKKVTGRGNPLILLRLLRRIQINLLRGSVRPRTAIAK